MSWNPDVETKLGIHPGRSPLEHSYKAWAADYVYTGTAGPPPGTPFNSRTFQWGGAPYALGAPPNPVGLGAVASPSFSGRGWWHIRKFVATYNSATNTNSGMNNSNYLGYTRVGLMLELGNFDQLQSNAAGTHAIGRFLGRKVGHARIGLNDAQATVQIIDAELDITVRGGSVLMAKLQEHPLWGVFQQAYVIARQFDAKGA